MTDLKIGWVSAASFATTGYGRMTLEICGRLINKGYDVTVIGGIGGNTVWGGKLDHHAKLNDNEIIIPNVPTFGEVTGSDVMQMYLRKYKLNTVIGLWDSFAIPYLQDLSCYSMAYIPVDSPFTKKMSSYVNHVHKIIAMSKFGYEELTKWFDHEQVTYLPHGINTTEWCPVTVEQRAATREKYNIAADEFVFLTVAANVGERKQLPFMLLAFREFVKKYPKSKFFLFTSNNVAFPKGYDLAQYVAQLGINKNVIFPEYEPMLESYSNAEMIALYGMADVYLSASLAEGFGVPLLESMSCGLPVIAPRNSTVPELIAGHGYVYDCNPDYTFVPVFVPTLQEYPVPSMQNLLLNMELAYIDPELRKRYGCESRSFAVRNYDWNVIMPNWYTLLDHVSIYQEMFV